MSTYQDYTQTIYEQGFFEEVILTITPNYQEEIVFVETDKDEYEIDIDPETPTVFSEQWAENKIIKG